MSRQLPDKLYFRIGEVAEIVGVEPHVLRYWETEFRSVNPEKSRRGQRVYSRRDVDTLLRVKELLYGHRYTIAGARRKLRTEGLEPIDESDPVLKENKALRETLTELRAELGRAIEAIEAL
ncbi:MAG TPA: MerR family transcriptional regulator [Polyangiaceae bacterium]|nr:MerR family transcriptional regulator [Polyangiaceae bacterium]